MDLNKHRYYLMQVLLAIFHHPELSKLLAFKGGTIVDAGEFSATSDNKEFNVCSADSRAALTSHSMHCIS